MKIQPNAIQPNCVYQIKANVKVLCASIQKNFVTTKLIASMTKSITFVVSNFCRFMLGNEVDEVTTDNISIIGDPNASVKCAELKCSYNCKITPAGPKCYCPIGQEPNGTQCQGL